MALAHKSSGDPHPAAHNEERDAINQNTTDIAARIIKPATPQLGELLRFDGTNWARTQTRWFEGNGSPEGVIAAPPGSRYVQMDAAGGATDYIKRTGTGNTGWTISFLADTGWRNVLGQVTLTSGAAKYSANIRRWGNVVDVYFDLDTPTASGNWNFYTLPSGFRPDFGRYGALQDNKEAASTSTLVGAAGVCTLTTIKGGARDRWSGQWLTSEGWPTTLPGSVL